MFKLLTLIIGGYLLYYWTMNPNGFLSGKSDQEDLLQKEDDEEYTDYEEVE